MADGLTIITNNIPRNMIYGYELTDKERKEFDYMDNEEGGLDCADFTRYRGQVYHLGEFLLIDECSELMTWEGYVSDTAFSGVVIRRNPDNIEQVIVGRYFS